MTRPTDKNRRNLYIKQEDYAYLAKIGNGYADGLRKAVEAHKNQPQVVGAPVTMPHGDRFLPADTNAVMFQSDKGLCVIQFEYLKWLVDNATGDSYQDFIDNQNAVKGGESEG